MDELGNRYRQTDIGAIVALEARGFTFGAALAYQLQLPLVLIRKAGKLPGKTEKIGYTSEYGKDAFEIEKGILAPRQKVLVMDDVLATGKSAAAACMLVEHQGAEVLEVACLIELSHLEGRKQLQHPVFSLVDIDS